MGIFGRRTEEKRELARARDWGDDAYARLFEEGAASDDVRVRRVAQSAAIGASLTVGSLRMSNSPVHFSEDEGTGVIESALRRAQWAVGIVQVRLAVTEEEMDPIMEACIAHVAGGDLADDLARLWSQARDGEVPSPGASFNDLAQIRWFQELAVWILRGSTPRPGKPTEQCLMTAIAQLVLGCTESVAVYSGQAD